MTSRTQIWTGAYRRYVTFAVPAMVLVRFMLEVGLRGFGTRSALSALFFGVPMGLVFGIGTSLHARREREALGPDAARPGVEAALAGALRSGDLPADASTHGMLRYLVDERQRTRSGDRAALIVAGIFVLGLAVTSLAMRDVRWFVAAVMVARSRR